MEIFRGRSATPLFTVMMLIALQPSGSVSINATDPRAPKIIFPKFCNCPPSLQTEPWAARMDPAQPSAMHYMISTTSASGDELNILFSSSTNAIGYQLDEICEEIAVDEPPVACASATCPPSPPPWPLYFRESTAPRGCHEISLLPTLTKETDLDLTAFWILLMLYLFYGLALVCEEFFVPAINLLCEKLSISDDVAGATLLAMGCNAPELFASAISVFVADSTVGVGTIVGSTPFNVFCITAGCALGASSVLELDPWLIGRELLALGTSIALFFWVMDDYIVEWYEALVMVLFYVAVYVPIVTAFPKVKAVILHMSNVTMRLRAASAPTPQPRLAESAVSSRREL